MNYLAQTQTPQLSVTVLKTLVNAEYPAISLPEILYPPSTRSDLEKNLHCIFFVILLQPPLERGTVLRYIQTLLGYSNSKTTKICMRQSRARKEAVCTLLVI